MARSFNRYIGVAALSFVVILYVMASVFLFGLVPAVRFTREEIVIDVYPDRIAVRGSFTYENPFPVPIAQGLFFPVPVDERHFRPSSFTVTMESPVRREIPVHGRGERSRFDLYLGAGDEADILIRYDQRVERGSATYVLTTTRMWRRPLDAGVYRLKPRGVRITGSNYPLLPDPGGGLYFERKGFMPPEDWSFSWVKE
jgi:hypothetical protein